MRLLPVFILCLWLAPAAFAVRTVVLRDTIGCDAMGANCTSTASDGLPGSTAVSINNSTGASPRGIFTSSGSGILEEAKFVAYSRKTI